MSLRPPASLEGALCAAEAEAVLALLVRRPGTAAAGAGDVAGASAPELARLALRVALDGEESLTWSTVYEEIRTRKEDFDELDSLLLLHCMVRMDCFDRTFFSKLVDRIECRYFSMELALDLEHPALELFSHEGSYRSLVDNLPIDHKVKLILVDDIQREDGRTPRRKPKKEADAKAAWQTMEPVDMEEKEKERFYKGRIRVLDTRHVQARVSRMRPGKKLRAALAVQLMQAIPIAMPAVLAQIAQVTALSKERLLHGDLQRDFQEALARRLCSFENSDVVPCVIAFACGIASYGGPAAFQAWRTKVVPSIVRALRPEFVAQNLDAQHVLHPRLRGVPHRAAALDASALPQEDVLRARLDRAVALFVAVTTAKQVNVDCELFDALANPVKRFLEQFMELQAVLGHADPTIRLPLELLADIASALVTSGVRDMQLAGLLARAFSENFGEDIASGSLARSRYCASDLATLAHAIAYAGGEGAGDAVGAIWTVAEPKLRSTAPHLALMLLDAVVRGGSEELLTSPPLLTAVDELLVQRLDFDPAMLGDLGH